MRKFIVFLATILAIGVTFEITKALDPSSTTYWTSPSDGVDPRSTTPVEKSLSFEAPRTKSKSSASYGACTKSLVKEEQAAHGLLRNS